MLTNKHKKMDGRTDRRRLSQVPPQFVGGGKKNCKSYRWIFWTLGRAERRKNASKRIQSSAEVNPHQAGEAQLSLFTTIA